MQYLQMIQGVIDRMSTTAALFKGFCATVVTGITALSFTEINKWVLLIAVIPVVVFFVIDSYYLILEKEYRILYELVRTGKNEDNFDMSLSLKQSDRIKGNASFWGVIKSPSILVFYIPMMLICATIVLLKFFEII